LALDGGNQLAVMLFVRLAPFFLLDLPFLQDRRKFRAYLIQSSLPVGRLYFSRNL